MELDQKVSEPLPCPLCEAPLVVADVTGSTKWRHPYNGCLFSMKLSILSALDVEDWNRRPAAPQPPSPAEGEALAEAFVAGSNWWSDNGHPTGLRTAADRYAATYAATPSPSPPGHTAIELAARVADERAFQMHYAAIAAIKGHDNAPPHGGQQMADEFKVAEDQLREVARRIRALAPVPEQTVEPNGDIGIGTGAAIAWLTECARYFDRLPSEGEDARHWSNFANTRTARRIAKLISTFPPNDRPPAAQSSGGRT